MATVAVGSMSPLFTEIAPTEPAGPPAPWPALIVHKGEIDREVERLCDLQRSPGQIRASSVVHPSSRATVPSVAPGLSVSIHVVRPGESVTLNRDNASRVEFGISGAGVAKVGGKKLAVGRWDAWTVPSMNQREYRCEGAEPLVWLSYSNAPMLARLDILYSDASDAAPSVAEPHVSGERYVRQNAPDFPVLSDGARLRGYEFLTDIEVVENKPLLWPWAQVEPHLSTVPGDGKRNILLLYNPATGRRNGTTHSFFATLSSIPGGRAHPVPERGHKHSSFACNYHFQGAGESVVDGERFGWEAGDLMLSAPSWSEHAHGASDKGASILTIQDHPFQIGVESLIWQEKMDGPILTLGSEPGQTGYVGPRQAGN